MVFAAWFRLAFTTAEIDAGTRAVRAAGEALSLVAGLILSALIIRGARDITCVSIEVDGFHVFRNNRIEQLPTVGLVEVIKPITAEADHQLVHSILVYIHGYHLPRINCVPLLPVVILAPHPESVGRPIITSDTVIQSDHVLGNDSVELWPFACSVAPVKPIPPKGRYKLICPIIVNIHCKQRIRVCGFPPHPFTDLSPIPEPMGSPEVTSDAAIQSDHVFGSDSVDLRPDTRDVIVI